MKPGRYVKVKFGEGRIQEIAPGHWRAAVFLPTVIRDVASETEAITRIDDLLLERLVFT